MVVGLFDYDGSIKRSREGKRVMSDIRELHTKIKEQRKCIDGLIKANLRFMNMKDETASHIKELEAQLEDMLNHNHDLLRRLVSLEPRVCTLCLGHKENGGYTCVICKGEGTLPSGMVLMPRETDD